MDTIMDTVMKLRTNVSMLSEEQTKAIAKKEMLRLVDILKNQLQEIEVKETTVTKKSLPHKKITLK